ncbi:MAG: 1-deoxy-D-xylulose-5-phosphate synthase [Kiritimatiellae bacterium]|nr:1-deoxy-D-xylulose-5-phosphate synthase [Kiritimatiellia bacterium]
MDLREITGPEALKKVPAEKLNELCDEMRAAMLKRTAAHGGHVGPNLGFLEATVALHRVFNSPVDKIIFDVSHQAYPHKMLTGRMEAYLDEDKYDSVSGYTEPSESVHDHFIIGHTSTSVSLACGMAKARDLKGEKYNVIAVIGDGSLTGGMAFEGLNNRGEQGGNAIIIFNDNQMSIAENHGGFLGSLKKLRETKGEYPCNFFKALGLDYMYVDEGNDVHKLIAAFEKVKDIDHPIVVHVNTEKGHGYKFATENKEPWHWSMPWELETGKAKREFGESINDRTAEYLLEKMKTDKSLVAISAAVPTFGGFNKARRERAGKQFVDVGICEEHAAAFSSALAKSGARPVWFVASTFLQRAYDQLSHDIAVNSSPAVIVVTASGLSSMNDVTHVGFFDIPMASNIPNLVHLSPTSEAEYFAMLEWALTQREKPVMIRMYEKGAAAPTCPVETDFSEIGKFQVVKRGKKVALFGLGTMFSVAEETAKALKDMDIDATLVNPRFSGDVDTALIKDLAKDHDTLVTLEDGVIAGGFGEKVARVGAALGLKVIVKGAKKQFEDRYNPRELLARSGLTVDSIVFDLLKE